MFVFNGVAMYCPTIPSCSCKYVLPTTLDLDPHEISNKKVVEEIKMWENAKIGFTEMDEDRNMKDEVWAQTAKTNGIILNQSTEERMDRNAKSTIEIIFKNY